MNDPGAAPSLHRCPIVASPRLAFLPAFFAGRGGLESLRTCLAYAPKRGSEPDETDLGAGAEDAPEFLRVRFFPADMEDEEAVIPTLQHVADDVAMDIYHAELSVARERVVRHDDDDDDSVICTVDRRVRALLHLPCVTVQTLDITCPAPNGGPLVMEHLVRAPASGWTFRGSMAYNSTPNSSAPVFFLQGSSADEHTRAQHISCAYLTSDPRASVEGVRLLPGADDGPREAAMRIRVAASALVPAPSVTVHVVTCLTFGQDAHKSLTALLDATDDVAEMVQAHERAWAELWNARVDVAPKVDGPTPEETDAVMRVRFSLRLAMYHLHATGGGRSDLSGISAAGAACVHVAPLSTLFRVDDPPLPPPTRRLRPPAQGLGLSGLHLDLLWTDLGRWLDPAAGGPLLLSGNAAAQNDGGAIKLYGACLHAASLWDRYRVTGDAMWLRTDAAPVIFGVADLVASIVRAGPAQTTYPYHAEHRVPARLVTGLDETRRWGENSALNVAAARAALYAALQTALAVAPGDPRRQRWGTVLDGLTQPLIAGTPLALDIPSSPAAIQASAAIRVLGDVLLPMCHPALRFASGVTESTLHDRLAATLDHWTPLLHAEDTSPAALSRLTDGEARVRRRRRASNLLWTLHAQARLAQRTPSRIDGFAAGLETLFAEFGDAWGALTLDAEDTKIGPDMDLAASLVTTVVMGLLGTSIEGEVAETALYSSELGGASVAASAVMPSTWAHVALMGAGRWRRDCVVPNRVLFATSLLTQTDIQPWTVDYIA